MSICLSRVAARRLPTAFGRWTLPPQPVRSFASTSINSNSTSGSPAPLPPHLLTLADLSTSQIQSLLNTAANFKASLKAHSHDLVTGAVAFDDGSELEQTLKNKTVALLFTKRSTRTRVASETSTVALGGHPMFLGPSDIQLGVNESLYDTAKVVGSMVDGIMARVDGHEEVEVRN